MRSTPTEPEHVRSTSHDAPARPELHPTMLRRFLAYYKPERGLLIADTVCALVIAGIAQLVVSGLAVGIVTIVAAIATVARGGLAAAFIVKAVGIDAFDLGILRLIVTRCDIFCRCTRNKLYRVLRQIVRHIRALDNLDALNDLVLRFILLKNQTHESNLSDNQQTAPWSQ